MQRFNLLKKHCKTDTIEGLFRVSQFATTGEPFGEPLGNLLIPAENLTQVYFNFYNIATCHPYIALSTKGKDSPLVYRAPMRRLSLNQH